MKWKKYIESISTEYHVNAPATNAEIMHIKDELNIQISEKLLELFRETNGIFDRYGCPLIWSTKQIVEDNLFFRNFDGYKDIYMPFDHLLFVSDAGNGDLFGYRILNGSIQDDEIYAWNHEDDSRTWVSSSLENFVKGWISGEITV
ncbi:SMI1/KNR4 family protein [Bacillus sp. FJAT-22090]|uniref:SMI1/KNR4 family protein n=1 Tax=Bacillus sp. FJAT-22090 TaxID=1581038 RepID=UPI0011AB0B84|nr:SMI1/KNR4 family protein [Bacillus sp. FJAT-22090]